MSRSSDSPDLLVPLPAGLPLGWEIVPLGKHLVQIRNGLNSPQSAEPPGHPVSRIQTLTDSGIAPTRVRYISDLSPSELHAFLLDPGDLLFSHINSEPQIGRSAVYAGDPPGLIHGVNLLRLKVNHSQLDPHFLNLLFRWYRRQGVFLRLGGRAVGQSSINQGRLKSLLILKPPLSEQHRITRVLSAVQRASQQTDQVISAARELRHSLVQHLFSYGPVRVDEVDARRRKETPLGSIPEEWSVAHLRQVASIQTGYAFKSQDYSTDGIPLVRIANVKESELDWSTLVRLPENYANDYAKYMLHPGDILISMTGSVGITAVVRDQDVPSLLNQRVGRLGLKGDCNISPQFLAVVVSTPHFGERVREAAHGSAQANVSPRQIEDVVVPLPPEPEQHTMTGMVNAISGKISAEERRRDVLHAAFETLLSDLMTGRLRVSPRASGLDSRN
jgi:type I restriction enzyme, S subunit